MGWCRTTLKSSNTVNYTVNFNFNLNLKNQMYFFPSGTPIVCTADCALQAEDVCSRADGVLVHVHAPVPDLRRAARDGRGMVLGDRQLHALAGLQVRMGPQRLVKRWIINSRAADNSSIFFLREEAQRLLLALATPRPLWSFRGVLFSISIIMFQPSVCPFLDADGPFVTTALQVCRLRPVQQPGGSRGQQLVDGAHAVLRHATDGHVRAGDGLVLLDVEAGGSAR